MIPTANSSSATSRAVGNVLRSSNPAGVNLTDAPNAASPTYMPATGGDSVSQRLRRFLRSLDMTVYQISRVTERPPFGKGTRAYIRDAFYAELECGQTPDIHQIAALARITGYRFVDWLALFGYRVDDVLRLQLELHPECTLLLPSTIYDPLALVPWIRRLDRSVDLERTYPLAAAIDALGYAPVAALGRWDPQRFLYARVGRRDDMMRPRFAPGSIVRVNPATTTIRPGCGRGPVYLVEHAGGLCCCYVERLDDQHVILLPDDGASRVRRCRIGTEARILGSIDLEFRPLRPVPSTQSAHGREKGKTSQPLRLLDPRGEGCGGPGLYARTARERMGLCFREAQAITRQLAARFDDKHYKVALGSLSDAETFDALPRHVQKIFSLCVAYGMDVWAFLRAGGVPVDELDGPPIPPQFLGGPSLRPGDDGQMDGRQASDANLVSAESDAMDLITARLGEVPLFLLRSIEAALGHEQLSLDDLYVWGEREPVLHPLLRGAMLVLVDRHQRSVPDARPKRSPVKRPLFVVRAPTGQLLAGMAARDRDVLLIYPHSTSRERVLAFQAGDVDVIGRISGVLRAIGPDPRRLSAAGTHAAV